MQIPDGMPVLKANGHQSPDDGACAMEYISVLLGGEFTDYPPCTEVAVAWSVQMVNDYCRSNDERSEILIPRIQRIMAARPLPIADVIRDSGQTGCRPRVWQDHTMPAHTTVSNRVLMYGYPMREYMFEDMSSEGATGEMVDATLDHHDMLLWQFARARAMSMPGARVEPTEVCAVL